MLARIQRRIKYEILKRSRDRRPFAAEIAEHERTAEVYVRSLGIEFGNSISTGCEFGDYMLLHRYVLTRRPPIVIELGAGASTLVLAHALKMTGGRLYTYEAIEKYFDNLLSIIPHDLKGLITPVLAASVETDFDGIRGVRFDTKLPAGAQMIFVDGPTEMLKDGTKGACLDLLFYLREHPCAWLQAIIDQKFSCQEAYESVLPQGSVRYDPEWNLGFIEGTCGELLRPPRRVWNIRNGDVLHLVQ